MGHLTIQRIDNIYILSTYSLKCTVLSAQEAQVFVGDTHKAIIATQIVILEKTECSESRKKEYKFNVSLISYLKDL